MTTNPVAEAEDAVLAVKAALADDDDAVALLIDQNYQAGRLPTFFAVLVGLAAGALAATGDPDRLLAELSRRCVDNDPV
ncbi:MAG: hypothetical protein ACM3ZF_12030 [Mycobacterium leprae]